MSLTRPPRPRSTTLLPDLLYATLALIVLVAFVMIWRVEGDDPAWAERWRALSPAERARIARAARSGALLASQEEIELAAGFARRDRRGRTPYTLRLMATIPVGGILIVGGILADSVALIAFGTVVLLGGLWSIRGTERLSRAERETIARDRAL